MSFLSGVGAVLEKVMSYIPGREEKLRRDYASTKREMDALTRTTHRWTVVDYDKYRVLALKLRKIEEQLASK